ncbi:MAG: tetratricopeptide repeat protein [Haloarculaceae archaeon]
MSDDDDVYGNERTGDREAVADYLHGVADRIAAGDPLPFGDDREALTATSPVTFGVRSRTNGDETAVRLELTWASDDAERSETDGSDTNGGDTKRSEANGGGRARGDTRRGANVEGSGAVGGDAGLAPPEDDLPDPSVGTRDAESAARELDHAVRFARKGKTTAADSRFRRAIEADPADASIRRRYAAFLQAADEPRRALAQFERALDIAPDDPDLRTTVANFHWERGNVDAATEQFERALDRSPGDPDVLAAYGRFCWEERDDVEAAIDHLRTALDADPDHALAHLNFAVLLRHAGREDRAADHYEQALELGEGDATVHAEYGHYLWADGDVEAAARHYAKARELGGDA